MVIAKLSTALLPYQTLFPNTPSFFVLENFFFRKGSKRHLVKHLFTNIIFSRSKTRVSNYKELLQNSFPLIFRWAMVYFPDQTDSIFTRRNSKFMILACWILPILIMIPTVTNHWIRMDCKTRSCTITEEYKKILLSMVFLPGLVLLVSNVMIYIKVGDTIRNCIPRVSKSLFLVSCFSETIFSWNGTPSVFFF